MEHWKKFKSFKQRGEWAELRFMAEAAERGFCVLKPWGDNRPYDVGIDHGDTFLRVQVKCTTCRVGTGYFCQFMPSDRKERYKLNEIDLFAVFVIPVKAWYIIPAALLLGPERKVGITIWPVLPLKKDRYRYEGYRDAWLLLSKSRRALIERVELVKAMRQPIKIERMRPF
jgi:PD-(D/E)XK endonuclease